MTPQEAFYTKLTALAGMCPHFTLTPEIIRLYDEHLVSLGYDKASQALNQLIVSRNSRDPFPSIKEIRAIVEPEENPEDHASIIASSIFGAIARIGPYRSDQAREYLGEIAWRVVTSEGGWESVCQIVTDDNAGMFKSQWRKLALALIHRKSIFETRDAITDESGGRFAETIGSPIRRLE